jgi:hypothetical protein
MSHYDYIEDEALRGIAEELYPEIVVRSPRGKAYRPYIYDRMPYKDKETGQAIYKLRHEDLKILVETMQSVRNGTAYRKAADYMTTHVGAQCSYQKISEEFKLITERLPEWKEIQTKVNNFAGEKHFTKKQTKAEKDKTSKKRRLSRKMREMELELKRITAEEAVESGKLPEEALENIDQYVTDKGHLKSQKQIQVVNENIEAEKKQNVIFKPNEGPQTDFLAAPEREVLYGGAAGGGKSYACS